MIKNYNILFFILCTLLWLPLQSYALVDADSTKTVDSTHTSRFNIHFQATYIYQYKPSFYAKYSGKNSLSNELDKENSITSTLYLGVKLWKGAEAYVNPEIAGGSGLSGAYGLGAAANGETFRVGDPAPTLYLARGYITQTIPLGKVNDAFTPEGANETGGMKPIDFIKFYLGKMSLGDLFDNSACANSPRTQFLNWCLMNNGAWDYAANLRGYTYTFATVVQKGSMAYKAALAMMPTVANGPTLNTDLSQEYSINAEADKTFKAGANKRPGNIRLLGYYNNGDMGNYAQAIKNSSITGDIPDVISTRKYGRGKTGFGLSADEQLTNTTTAFLRAGWSDGQNETWCFTEVDETLSAGVNLKGSTWKRNDDIWGVAIDANGLSKNHRNYLADGGYGFEIGDGALSYSPESVLETYYSYKTSLQSLWLTLDYQFVVDPGYNSVRGPVNIFSFRLHAEL